MKRYTVEHSVNQGAVTTKVNVTTNLTTDLVALTIERKFVDGDVFSTDEFFFNQKEFDGLFIPLILNMKKVRYDADSIQN